MDELEGFVFFCDDCRQEAGNKMSYMGVLGPVVHISPPPADAPGNFVASLSKLVVACFIRNTSKRALTIDADIYFRNAPENVLPHARQSRSLSIDDSQNIFFFQFNGVIPNIPVKSGMEILAKITVEGHIFEASLTVADAPQG